MRETEGMTSADLRLMNHLIGDAVYTLEAPLRFAEWHSPDDAQLEYRRSPGDAQLELVDRACILHFVEHVWKKTYGHS